MKEKDKTIVKDSALAVIDAAVSTSPPLSLAWGLCKAVLGSSMKLRQERSLKWVEMLQKNPKLFTKKLLEQEEFQDGFLISFEKYIKERQNEKREIIKKIFLGFSTLKNKKDFEMERMYDVLTKLSPYHINLLRKNKKGETIIIKNNERNVAKNDYSSYKYLEYLGLFDVKKTQEVETEVETEVDTTGIEESDVNSEATSEAISNFYEQENFSLSIFGEDFIKFIKK